MEPEICTKILKKMSEKLRAKFPATTPSCSMVKVGRFDDSFLEVFLTASKFAAIHHLNRLSLSDLVAQSGRVTVDLIRRLWIRLPPRTKDFFFTPCGSLFPVTEADAQWVIHGFN